MEGVRATRRTLVEVREEVRAWERTCCAVVAFIECVCSSRECAAACCAVKGDEGFGGHRCHHYWYVGGDRVVV